ncbi:hypothetical protein PNK_1044 [Candidatus Protochlamydia naegleriophila]|uniref:F-box domain-containing protein n=1 Tax=Candidatus Protochlamydia naegleriophila TaxID=389348 RepID=A0A0U5JFI6_9BACT|nr:F-box protein [Candidatus Protochlamydia naegleriophila]CUI16661.1 hypothetical protein PNK_1044 [Candidatus Protochlamydia naegleriophila]
MFSYISSLCSFFVDYSTQTGKKDSEQDSAFGKLPPELLVHIFSYMNEQELASGVRLVNNRWQALVKESFDSLYEKTYRSKLLVTAGNVSTSVGAYLFNKKIERLIELKWQTGSSSVHPQLLNYMKQASPNLTVMALPGNRFIAANGEGVRQLSFELGYCAKTKQLSASHTKAQIDKLDLGEHQLVRRTDSHVLSVGREDKSCLFHLMNQENLAKIGVLELAGFSLSSVCFKNEGLWVGSSDGMIRKYLVDEKGFADESKWEFQAKGQVSWLEWIEKERLLLALTPGCLSIFSGSSKLLHVPADVLGVPHIVANHLVWRESTKEVKAIRLNVLAKGELQKVTLEQKPVNALIGLEKGCLMQLSDGQVKIMNEALDPVGVVQVGEQVKCAVQKGIILALGTAGGKVYLYEMAQSVDLQPKLLAMFNYPQHGDIESLSFSDTSILMMTTSQDKSLCAMPFPFVFKL